MREIPTGEMLAKIDNVSREEATEFFNKSGYANLVRSVIAGTTILNASLKTLSKEMAEKLSGYESSATNNNLAEQLPIFIKIVGIDESDIEKLQAILPGNDFSGLEVTREWFDQIKGKLVQLVEYLLQMGFTREEILQNKARSHSNN